VRPSGIRSGNVVLDLLLDLLLPRRCAACGRSGEILCPRCRRQVLPLRGPSCSRCGAPTAWPVRRCLECSGRRLAFASARAAVAYDGPVPALVSAWKERGLRILADVAADIVADTVGPPSVTALAFVPPDGDRSLKRGHHPAERLARGLGRRWELPVTDALRRTRTARPQRGLSLPARRRNVAGAFRPTARVPPRVALIDDVYTTGSTASAAASTLRGAGARRVEVVTFARTVRTLESGHRS
jgi:predicted amidophosphoribosyltransferase